MFINGLANYCLISKITAKQVTNNAFDNGGRRLFIASLLVLTLAYLAALARMGANTGELELWVLLKSDAIRPWMTFQDAFLRDGYPVSGWRVGIAPMFFPDYAITWLLFALGLDFRVVYLIFPLFIALVSIGGWCFVCDELFGRRWRRRAVVVLLHVPHFLFIAFGIGADVFAVAFMIVYHYGTWVMLLWILGCYLRILRLDVRRLHALPYILIAVLLTALTSGSDLLLVIWLVVPALAALTLMLWRREIKKVELLGFVVISAVSILLGQFLVDLVPVTPNRYADSFVRLNLDRAIQVAVVITLEIGKIAANNPVAAVLWAAGAAMLLWRFFDALKQPAQAAGDRGAVFIALFIPISAASGIAAVIITGNIHVPLPYAEKFVNFMLRYHLPFVYFPLFIGWALCHWRARPAQTNIFGVAAVIGLAALSAVQLAWSVDGLKSLNTYDSPFHKCFTAAAQRLNWHGGVMNYIYTLMLASNPDAGIERALPVGVIRRGGGESRLFLDWTVTSRHHFSGEFQFVVANKVGKRVFLTPPLTERRRRGCRLENLHSFVCGYPALMLDDTAVRGAFGEPAEIVNCAGVDLYHYDPPIKTYFPPEEDPHFAQIGRTF